MNILYANFVFYIILYIIVSTAIFSDCFFPLNNLV